MGRKFGGSGRGVLVRGATALGEALARGGRVVWDPPERPRLLVPRELRPTVEADREAVRAIMERAAVFREQAQRFIREGRGFPFLALPEAKGRDGGCLSAGASVDEARHFRCPLCMVAVRIALDMLPTPREAGRGDG